MYGNDEYYPIQLLQNPSNTTKEIEYEYEVGFYNSARYKKHNWKYKLDEKYAYYCEKAEPLYKDRVIGFEMVRNFGSGMSIVNETFEYK